MSHVYGETVCSALLCNQNRGDINQVIFYKGDRDVSTSSISGVTPGDHDILHLCGLPR